MLALEQAALECVKPWDVPSLFRSCDDLPTCSLAPHPVARSHPSALSVPTLGLAFLFFIPSLPPHSKNKDVWLPLEEKRLFSIAIHLLFQKVK